MVYIILIAVGVIFLGFMVIGIVHAVRESANPDNSLDKQIEILLKYVDDDDDDDEPIFKTIRCCGCDNPTNVQVGKSAECEFCGNAVHAPR
jgi:hypothetical protein